MATPHTLLELYSQVRIQLPTLPLFTFQRPDTAHCGLRIDDCGLKSQATTVSCLSIRNPQSEIRNFPWLAKAKFAVQPQMNRRE